MIENHTLLRTLNTKEDETVTISDNAKGKIVEIRNVDNLKNLSIENVLLIDGLNHNLININ